VPGDICDTATFERWREKAESEHPDLLCFSAAMLTRAGAPRIDTADFPDRIAIHGHRFPLRYRFEPGAEDDGITVTLPTALLNQLPTEPFEWLVPGLLREKIIALLRGLPKGVRKNFVPIPEYADACMERLPAASDSLTLALGHVLAALTGVPIPTDAWRPRRVDPHLLMNFELVGPDLAVIARGRDLAALRARFAVRASEDFHRLRDRSLDRVGLTDWSFGRLPDEWRFERGAMSLVGYPALVDEGTSVSLRLADTRPRARHLTAEGLQRLLRLRMARAIKAYRRALPQMDRLRLLYATVTAGAPAWVDVGTLPGDDLASHIVEGALRHCFAGDCSEIRDREAFDEWVSAGAAALGRVLTEVTALIAAVMALHQQVRRLRQELGEQGLAEHLLDVDEQLVHLVFSGFVTAIPLERLREYPRYLSALLARLQKLRWAPGKDSRRMRRIASIWKSFLDEVRTAPDPSYLEDVRWSIEELRVSVFAQELGTKEPISVERIQALWPRPRPDEAARSLRLASSGSAAPRGPQ
jgi:ATP-dependent helicase HrpA